MQVMQLEEQYCILGLVVSGDLIFLRVESRAPGSLLARTRSLLALQHISFPDLSLQELRSRTLLPKLPPAFLSAGGQRAWPSLSRRPSRPAAQTDGDGNNAGRHGRHQASVSAAAASAGSDCSRAMG